MNENKLDSSVNEYEERYRSYNYIKQLQWDMALGLQKVDNLKPSEYFEKLVSDNVDNTLFKDKSVYFRNTLIRSNYFNIK